MKTTGTFLLLFFAFHFLSGQGSNIKGQVFDHNESAVFFANSILYNAVDSSLVKLEYTDENGDFEFKEISGGQYFLEITYVGLEDIQLEPFYFEGTTNLNLETLKFVSPENNLEEVTITAQRPLLELKPDRVVMNVSGSINASGEDAFTLLKKSPGVVVDNNNNIAMLGKSGVIIHIDDKPTHLSGDNLVNYLKTISSAQIESIEIISNPSAKYDAEGSAGIINIKLIRDKSLGTKGSIESNISVGQKIRYGSTVRGDFREKNWSAFTSIGAYTGEGIENNVFYREQFGNTIDQTNNSSGDWKGLNLRTGVDFLLNDANTIGVLFNYAPSEGSWNSNSRALLSQTGTETIDSILVAESMDSWNDKNWNSNLNYKFESKGGKNLNIDLDYGEYAKHSSELQPNQYISANDGSLLNEKIFSTEKPIDIAISTAKVDYEQGLLGGQLGIGAKYSNVVTENRFDFSNVIDNNPILDTERSNEFKYVENVTAAYLNYSTQLEKLGIQAGLRMEHTNSTGTLTAMNNVDNQEVQRDYLDFFPNLAFSFQADPKNAFNLSYSRRLNRPVYELLNPFRNQLDELTFEQGNPFLNPEYANNLQLSHAWNYKINTSVSYSHVTDLMTRIVDTENENATFITWLNLEEQKSYSINISSPIPITEWWNSYTSLTGVQTSNKASFEEGKTIDLTVNTFNVYSQHSFKLPDDYSFEVSGWYNSPSIWGGNFRMDPMYSIDLGVQKKFLDNKFSVKLAATDIFKSQKWNGVSEFGSLYMNAYGVNDSQRVKLNVSYRFGNQELKNRKRKAGLDEEMERIQSN